MDILIECLDSNSISKYDYYIEIYNDFKSIYKGIFYGSMRFNGNINSVYNIIVRYKNNIKKITFIMGKCDYIRLVFDSGHYIKFRLKDINYPNLPIERGEIYLWQDLTA